MDARERAFYAQQQAQVQAQPQGQAEPLAKTLSDGNAEDDAAPVQLAQQEDTPSPQRNMQKPQERPDDMPQVKWQDHQNDIAPWNAYREGVKKIRDITNNEIFSLMQTHAFEGGQDKESTANGGILQPTLEEAKKSGKIEGLENATSPADLTPAQKAAVMRYYVNNAMERLGGSKALQTLPNREVAAAFADALVRFGPNGGADLIRAALVERMERNGREVPIEYKTARESRIGPNPFADLKGLLKDQKEIGRFLDELQKQRDKRVAGTKNENGEMKRNEHFRFKDLYP